MPQHLDPSNRVTVRIWPPCDDKVEKITEFSVGHVALQTYCGGPDGMGIYASFWPANRCDEYSKKRLGNRPGSERLCHQTVAHLHTRDMDDLMEAVPPIEIDLHSLDVHAINEEFLKFKGSNFNWKMIGSFFIRVKNAKNCSGLVSDLLVAGGIHQLFSLRSEMIRAAFLGFALGTISTIFIFKRLVYLYSDDRGMRLLLANLTGDSEEKVKEGLLEFAQAQRPLVILIRFLSCVGTGAGMAICSATSRFLSRKFQLNALLSAAIFPVMGGGGFEFLLSQKANLHRERLDIMFVDACLASLGCWFARRLANFTFMDTIAVGIGLFVIDPVRFGVSLARGIRYWDFDYFFSILLMVCHQYIPPLLTTSLVSQTISFSSIVCLPKDVQKLAEQAKQVEDPNFKPVTQHQESKSSFSLKNCLRFSFYKSNSSKRPLVGKAAFVGTTLIAGFFAYRFLNLDSSSLQQSITEGSKLIHQPL